MQLWLLRPLLPWNPWYDKTLGFVVRASSARAARRLAAAMAEYEFVDKANPWLDPLFTTCRLLTPHGKAEVVIQDFHAT